MGIALVWSARMRAFEAVPVMFLVVACGSSPETTSSTSPPPSPEPAAKPVAAGKLHDASKDEADGLTMRYTGKGVSLAELPMVADKIGLPVSGTADFSIDIVVPKVKGALDYSKATGRIELACRKCQIGDDVAKLQLTKNDRAKQFAPEGMAFGHVAIDRFEAKLDIIGGKLELTSWQVDSPDLEMQSALAVTFASTLDASALTGCMRYKPTEALHKRDPRTHDVLMLTGAQRGADGFFQIALAGTLGTTKKLAHDCTTSL